MTITTDQIAALRTEAGQHGDLELVAICDAALNGNTDAIAECERVIAAAQQHRAHRSSEPTV